MVIVKETYILAVQAKALRHRVTKSEDAWFLVSSSLPAPARSRAQLAASADVHLRNPADSNQPLAD